MCHQRKVAATKIQIAFRRHLKWKAMNPQPWMFDEHYDEVSTLKGPIPAQRDIYDTAFPGEEPLLVVELTEKVTAMNKKSHDDPHEAHVPSHFRWTHPSFSVFRQGVVYLVCLSICLVCLKTIQVFQRQLKTVQLQPKKRTKETDAQTTTVTKETRSSTDENTAPKVKLHQNKRATQNETKPTETKEGVLYPSSITPVQYATSHHRWTRKWCNDIQNWKDVCRNCDDEYSLPNDQFHPIFNRDFLYKEGDLPTNPRFLSRGSNKCFGHKAYSRSVKAQPINAKISHPSDSLQPANHVCKIWINGVCSTCSKPITTDANDTDFPDDDSSIHVTHSEPSQYSNHYDDVTISDEENAHGESVNASAPEITTATGTRIAEPNVNHRFTSASNVKNQIDTKTKQQHLCMVRCVCGQFLQQKNLVQHRMNCDIWNTSTTNPTTTTTAEDTKPKDRDWIIATNKLFHAIEDKRGVTIKDFYKRLEEQLQSQITKPIKKQLRKHLTALVNSESQRQEEFSEVCKTCNIETVPFLKHDCLWYKCEACGHEEIDQNEKHSFPINAGLTDPTFEKDNKNSIKQEATSPTTTAQAKQMKDKKRFIEINTMPYLQMVRELKKLDTRKLFTPARKTAESYRRALLRYENLLPRQPTTARRNKRRKLNEPPDTCKQVKDDLTSRKFTVCAEHLQELQNATTWVHETGDRPLFMPFMMTYDEMIKRPDKVRKRAHVNGDFFNDLPTITFLCPQRNFDRKRFATALECVAAAMKTTDTDSGDNWECTDDLRRYFQLSFGDKEFKPQGTNKQKKRK